MRAPGAVSLRSRVARLSSGLPATQPVFFRTVRLCGEGMDRCKNAYLLVFMESKLTLLRRLTPS